MDLEWGVQTLSMEALLSELVRFPRRCLVGFGFTHPPVNSGFRNIAEREAAEGRNGQKYFLPSFPFEEQLQALIIRSQS